jgi:putative hydrolase of HD superfamily
MLEKDEGVSIREGGKRRMKALVDFLFEAGFLKRLARSGYPYLGSGDESVADHTCRTLYIAYVLGQLSDGIDMGRLLKMCLFHDFPEARTGDLNYVNKKYVASNEEKVLSELSDRLPFGEEIAALVREFNDKRTPEALLANDADQLDLLFHVKEQADRGNQQTGPWIEYAYQRLATEPARQLGRLAMETDSTDWWLADRDDPTRT